MPGIDEALDKAFDAEEKDENNPPKVSEESAEGTEESESTTSEETTETVDGEGTGTATTTESVETDEDKEIAAGRELIKALKDPTERKKMIQYLAKESGFDLVDATPQEKKTFDKTVDAVLREKLADEYALLPANLGSTLEEIIQAAVDARVKPIENELLTAREAAQKQTLQNDLDWAYTNLNGFKEHEDAIFAKMQNLHKGPTVSVRDYLKDLYSVVVPADKRGKSSVTASPSPAQKTERADRLKLSGGSGDKAQKAPSRTPAPANKSLDEALDLAMDEQGL
jgi:hypothetical protein